MNRQTVLLSALAGVLVVALWWLFLYSPGQDELATVEEEITAAEDESSRLRAQVARLEAVRAMAPELEADLAAVESILPRDPALPGALRQIQAAADDAGVDVLQLNPARPAVVDEAIGLHEITLSLGVTGSYFQVVDFLRRIEDPAITSRGIEMNTLTIGTSEYPSLQVTISATMFALLDPVPEPADDDGAGEAVEDEASTADDTDDNESDAETDESGGDQ